MGEAQDQRYVFSIKLAATYVLAHSYYQVFVEVHEMSDAEHIKNDPEWQ